MAVVELQLVGVGEVIAQVQGGVEFRIDRAVGDLRGALVGVDRGVFETETAEDTELAEGPARGRVDRVDAGFIEKAVGSQRVGEPSVADGIEEGAAEIQIGAAVLPGVAGFNLGSFVEIVDTLGDRLGVLLRGFDHRAVEGRECGGQALDIHVIVVLLLDRAAVLHLEVQFVVQLGPGMLEGGGKLDVALILGVRADAVVITGNDAGRIAGEVGLGAGADEVTVVVIKGGADLRVFGQLVVHSGLDDAGEGPRLLADVLRSGDHAAGRGVEVAAVIGGGARPVILTHGHGAEEIEPARIVVGRDATIVAAPVADAGAGARGIARVLLALHRDVNDAGGAVGFVFGGWVRDDLDFLDTIGRHLLKHRGAVAAHQGGGLAIDED